MSDAPTSAEPKYNFLKQMVIESMNLKELKIAIAHFDISLLQRPTQWGKLSIHKALSRDQKNRLHTGICNLKNEYNYLMRQEILNNLMMIKRKLDSFLAQSSIKQSFEISVKELQKTFASCDHVSQKLSNPDELWKRFDGGISTITVISNQLSYEVNEQKENLTEKLSYLSRRADEFRRVESESYRVWDHVRMQMERVKEIDNCWRHLLREEVSCDWKLIKFQFKWTNDGYQAKYVREPETRLWRRKNVVPPAELLRRIKGFEQRLRTSPVFMIDSLLKPCSSKPKSQQFQPALFTFPIVLDSFQPLESISANIPISNFTYSF
ncbi:Protein CBG27248 [Caenorhabditis briggsae]|uniref:Protein CBG27248 n=1 Tax=Caenorhabditis briggsae TaxID=6238 RepID=B6IFX0_CAEBR|nr:Protein CBG27248 [Caenorhabditis briggsae]CAR98786.1 Protein CBG27248 [Caenorhabditis briggsae]